MDTQYLREQEFIRWSAAFDHKMDRVLGHIDLQTALNLTNERRLTKVEQDAEDCLADVRRKSAWVSGVVASIATAIMLAALKLFGTKVF